MNQDTPRSSQPPRRCTKSLIAEAGPCHEVESDGYCRVSFVSAARMIEPKQRTFDPTKTWYTRQAASVFRGDWKVFAKHSRYNAELNLAGLKDKTSVKAQDRARRKFHIQSVLLQQGIHRTFKLRIASISKSYSKATFEELFNGQAPIK